MRKVFIETFGCQMNDLDSDLLLSRMVAHGYGVAARREEADVILFNTCSVRAHAEDRALSRAGLAGRLKRRRPDLVVGIVGCMAQRRGAELFRRLPHVQIVAGPRHLGAVPRLVEEVLATGRRRLAVEDVDGAPLDGAEDIGGRAHRAKVYVKAMEGCDLGCSFCVVPFTRGRGVSRPPERILEEVRRLAGAGAVEVTLLGQTIDAYGRDLDPPVNLAELLCRVHEVGGIRRIRFLTSHPAFVGPELIGAMRDLPRVCKYLHLPPQSGSDRVLRAMRRGYTVERYLERVAALRRGVPGIELSGDFIVGFPGETPEDFERTAELLERVRFQNAFFFKYSPREGTAAAGLPDDVPEEEKRRRHAVLLGIQARVSLERNRARIGQRLEVLVEGPSRRDPGRWTGRTDTFQIVNFTGEGVVPGRFVAVEITGATALALSGRVA